MWVLIERLIAALPKKTFLMFLERLEIRYGVIVKGADQATIVSRLRSIITTPAMQRDLLAMLVVPEMIVDGTSHLYRIASDALSGDTDDDELNEATARAIAQMNAGGEGAGGSADLNEAGNTEAVVFSVRQFIRAAQRETGLSEDSLIALRAFVLKVRDNDLQVYQRITRAARS